MCRPQAHAPLLTMGRRSAVRMGGRSALGRDDNPSRKQPFGAVSRLNGVSRTRNEDVFQAFVLDAYPRLRRFAYLLVGDSHAAEDLVQTALARTYAAHRRPDERPQLDAYVRRVIVNAAISEGRRPGRRESATGNPPEPAGTDASTTGAIDDRDLLRHLLKGLPPRQRSAIVLRHYLDLSEGETAHAMKCSVGTVKSLTSRGLVALRNSVANTTPLGEDRSADDLTSTANRSYL